MRRQGQQRAAAASRWRSAAGGSRQQAAGIQCGGTGPALAVPCPGKGGMRQPSVACREQQRSLGVQRRVASLAQLLVKAAAFLDDLQVDIFIGKSGLLSRSPPDRNPTVGVMYRMVDRDLRGSANHACTTVPAPAARSRSSSSFRVGVRSRRLLARCTPRCRLPTPANVRSCCSYCLVEPRLHAASACAFAHAQS